MKSRLKPKTKPRRPSSSIPRLKTPHRVVNLKLSKPNKPNKLRGCRLQLNKPKGKKTDTTAAKPSPVSPTQRVLLGFDGLWTIPTLCCNCAELHHLVDDLPDSHSFLSRTDPPNSDWHLLPQGCSEEHRNKVETSNSELQ